MSIALGHSGQRFADIGASGRGALVGFLHVGYPDVPTSLAAFRALTGEGDGPGVDLVEVGLPYSDPVIDGVTNQRAGTMALQRGGTPLLSATARAAWRGSASPRTS